MFRLRLWCALGVMVLAMAASNAQIGDTAQENARRLVRHTRLADHIERLLHDGSGHANSLVKRQNITTGGGPSAGTGASTLTPSSSSRTPAAPVSTQSTTTRGGGLLSSLDNGLGSLFTQITTTTSTTSSAISIPPVVVNITSTLPLSTSTPPPTISLAPETLTQTISLPPTTTSSTSATAAANSSSSSSSGIGKSTTIIIIVVASCVGGAIAIWTIVRKVKLSPSKQFDRKLAPIDFSNNRHDSVLYAGSQLNFAAYSEQGHGKRGGSDDEKPWPLHRSPSMSSMSQHSLDGLQRKNSAGAQTLLDRANSTGGKSEYSINGSRLQPQPLQDVYPSMPPQQRSYGNLYGATLDEGQYYHQNQHYPGQEGYYAPPPAHINYGGGLHRQGSFM